MKVTSIFRCVVLVALLSWIGCAGVRAQILTASVSTTNAIGINQFLIYTMNVNTTSTPSITVNDTLSGAPVAIVSFTASSSTFAQVLTTNLPTVSAAVSFGASNVLLTLTVQATSAGTLNSSIISTDPSGIPLTATNFVNVITNGSVPVPPTNTTTADLAVSIVEPG